MLFVAPHAKEKYVRKHFSDQVDSKQLKKQLDLLLTVVASKLTWTELKELETEFNLMAVPPAPAGTPPVDFFGEPDTNQAPVKDDKQLYIVLRRVAAEDKQNREQLEVDAHMTKPQGLS